MSKHGVMCALATISVAATLIGCTPGPDTSAQPADTTVVQPSAAELATARAACAEIGQMSAECIANDVALQRAGCESNCTVVIGDTRIQCSANAERTSSSYCIEE